MVTTTTTTMMIMLTTTTTHQAAVTRKWLRRFHRWAQAGPPGQRRREGSRPQTPRSHGVPAGAHSPRPAPAHLPSCYPSAPVGRDHRRCCETPGMVFSGERRASPQPVSFHSSSPCPCCDQREASCHLHSKSAPDQQKCWQDPAVVLAHAFIAHPTPPGPSWAREAPSTTHVTR
jgi:hypothetical protein